MTKYEVATIISVDGFGLENGRWRIFTLYVIQHISKWYLDKGTIQLYST